MSLFKSRQRIAAHGEVFTPPWMVDAMLASIRAEADRIDSRFLEPACGSGNFLVEVLRHKLSTADAKYRQSDFERRHYALLALMCIYGVELLADNVSECRTNLLNAFSAHLGLDLKDPLYRAAESTLSVNLVHGDALTMRTHNDEPITFAEWGYLGKGQYQRRDFRLDILAEASAFSTAGTLFAHVGKHDLFTPTKSYPPLTVADIAGLTPSGKGEGQ